MRIKRGGLSEERDVDLMSDYLLIFVLTMLFFVWLPFAAFYVSKFAAVGWYKGKRFFDQNYLENQDNGKSK